ncbi:MAG: 4'-phosphopantetheinyl transferase superfamily protein [Longimicrobiales bacterium]|nr:4'-phosphopantetheinyl transferase superfamily protein [Longimicrobiales bacterium]
MVRLEESAPVSDPHTGFVGVDVVDLDRHRTADRTRDARFMERVFTEAERDRILSAEHPEVEVWMLWAAKEAAYKVVSKLQGAPPVFRHRAFEVIGEPDTADAGVRCPGVDPDPVPVRVGLSTQTHADRVMAHAWDDPSSVVLVSHATVAQAIADLGVGEPLESWQAERFSAIEGEALHGLASALVRLMARREAAALLEVSESRLAIVCPPGHAGLRPPYLLLDGARVPGADVSLSHDGSHLAWALRVPWTP